MNEDDGKSLVLLLKDTLAEWQDRTIAVHYHSVYDPIKWKHTTVMTDKWRLINNKDLYNVQENPGHKNNIIQEYIEVVDLML